MGTAIMSYPWKLIHLQKDYAGRSEQVLLYDLARDPLEQNDVSKQYLHVVEILLEGVEEVRKSGSSGLEAIGVEGEMHMRVLEALGY